ncbi:hypothetical protein V757_01080 [Pelistega indica]|uniref:DUF4054 domain-containing protein n=1 Tax=Pelistega indica TaxID=1414851 RepID=V8GA45_9BURK|nr:DUF4054 domain-containing protein [Pelistega indica]ETD72966.1 hypothetical protein V757_01080 [Pelistega indica]
MQTVDEFKLRYPEFKDTDANAVGFFMEDADAEIDKARWGKLFKRGLFALTAHLIQLANQAKETGGAAAKDVVSETAGSLSVAYAPTATTTDSSTYHLTAYGQEFLRLRKLVGIGFMVV